MSEPMALADRLDALARFYGDYDSYADNRTVENDGAAVWLGTELVNVPSSLRESAAAIRALLQRVADAERQPEVITVWDLETQNAIGDFGERDIFDLLRRLAQYADLERAAREAQDLADARAESNTAYVLTVRKHYLAGVECLHEQKQDVARCGYGDWQSEPQASVGDAVDRWMDHVADELDAALRALGGEPPPPSEPNRYVHSGACGGQPAGSPCICGVGFPDYRDTLDQAPVEPPRFTPIGPETWQAGATNPPSTQAPVEPRTPKWPRCVRCGYPRDNHHLYPDHIKEDGPKAWQHMFAPAEEKPAPVEPTDPTIDGSRWIDHSFDHLRDDLPAPVEPSER